MNTVKHDYHDLVRRDVLALLPGHAGRVLDFGGGIGATSSALKAEGRASHAVVADLVEGARPAEIDRTFTGDLNRLDLVDRIVDEAGPFDTILCLDILEHLYDPWAVMARLARGLSPGGSVVASIPNVNYIGLVGPLVLFGRWELQDAGMLDRTHIRWFTRKTASELMTGAGLTLRRVDHSLMPRKYRLLDCLTMGAFRRFFVMQYVLVAASGEGTPR